MKLGYYSQGALVKDVNKIIKRNYKKGFILDLLSLLGMLTAFVEEFKDIRPYFHWLLFLKIRTVLVIIQRFENLFFSSDIGKNIFDLIKLIMLVISMIHISACLFFGVGKIEYYWMNHEVTWISNDTVVFAKSEI